ncbi:hypothetical protein B0T17DRAFT_273996 [Bombardia bombarda]|uniref:DUF6594 domain-containing protein n=1 Tax=Bombardia bombarda TaxID=252184 RepID=A0AA39X1B7_9PEZI|nr:hypothetical protein B0T17DRAFT_273996 [Bombardia bombarda]
MSLARPEPDLEHVKEAIDEDWAPHDDLSDEDEEQTREGDEDNDEDENEEDVEEEKGVCSGVEPGGQSKSDMTAPSRQPTDNRARPGIHLNQPYSDVQHRITSPKTAERLKSPRPLSAPDNFFQSRPRGAKFGRARSTRDPISREVTNEDENKQADDDSELTLAVSSDSGDDKTLSPRSRIDSGTVTPRLLGGEQNSDRSESSSESASTVTQGSTGRHEKMRKTGILAPKEVEPKTLGKPRRKPNALSFLDQDSPPLTEERIRQTVAAATEGWSPRSISSASSVGTSSLRSLVDTDATTPEQSINGDMSTAIRRTTFSPLKPSSTDSRSGTPTRAEPNRQQRILSKANVDAQNDRYGTPEMARGSAKHPLIPPSELQPRLLTPGHGHAKHLPRAEKLPLTGYELLAAKLSGSGPRPRRRSGSSDGTSPSEKDEATIKPIYRRFEALNHRLLLYLQDELNELEEQLHRLDTADTQTRRLQNCILPASRRAEFMAGGELQWHKQDILSKIGFKLEQYSIPCSHLFQPDARTTPSAHVRH